MATPINKKDIEAAKNVVKYGVPVLALGVSTANMATNASRHKKDEQYQKKQLEAMNKLTDSLNTVNTSMSNFNSKNFPQYREKKKKGGFFGKIFSLRDDGINFRRKVDLEGLLGDGKIEELRDWLLEKSADPRLQNESQYNTENFLEEITYSVSINENPKRNIVNLLYSCGVLEILFVNPRSNEVSKIDKVLDEYCSKYDEEVGYIATQPAHSIFHVEIKLKEGTESEVPEMLHEEDFKINVLINKNK